MKVTVLFFRKEEDEDPENEGTYDLAAVPRLGDSIEDDGKFWDVTYVSWRVSDGAVTVQCSLREAKSGDDG